MSTIIGNLKTDETELFTAASAFVSCVNCCCLTWLVFKGHALLTHCNYAGESQATVPAFATLPLCTAVESTSH